MDDWTQMENYLGYIEHLGIGDTYLIHLSRMALINPNFNARKEVQRFIPNIDLALKHFLDEHKYGEVKNMLEAGRIVGYAIRISPDLKAEFVKRMREDAFAD